MSNKPAQPTQLQKGKLLGSPCHAGFVDTFNWMESSIENLKGGKGCEVKNIESGHPEIEVKIQPGDGVEVVCPGPGQAYTISLVEPPQEGGGLANLSVVGTDDTYAVPLSGVYVLSAMPDTNLSVTCPTNGDGEPGNVIAIGVYWI